MSGHSKWSTIKHKKALLDSKRGRAFTKLIKEITICARVGGGDPNSNARLRLLVDKAKELNMPLENTARAIKRGTGELPGVHYEQYLYEGYGPYGIAIVIDVLSDNKNKAASEIRHLFTSRGGNLGESGSVSWMFEKLGVIHSLDTTMSEDVLLEKLIDYDIKDIKQDESGVFIYCDIKSLDAVKKAVEAAGLKVEKAELEWVPKNTVSLSEEQAEKAYEFLDALEEQEDIQNVYTNLE
ncbi:YebC/PmpR family DNA-binding transcriptional regulator [Candidatus Dependentiae bacterium HGW-Dependentiae-1]|nr:MAG: YebC/PmpR family DNA-binding transcriptional regulator [Candidatus Dependentiae bacterium HGW-Dependentiae-1]